VNDYLELHRDSLVGAGRGQMSIPPGAPASCPIGWSG